MDEVSSQTSGQVIDQLDQSVDQTVSVMGRLLGSDMAARVVLGVVIIVCAAVIAHLLTRLIRRLTNVDGAPVPSGTIVVNVVRVVVWGIGAAILLDACFGVNVTGLIAALGIGGIALSLGLQDTISNFLGGLQVTFAKIVQPGDGITVGNASGVVEDVTWRQTVIKDIDGSLHIIPNSVINSTVVKKWQPTALVAVPFVIPWPCADLNASAARVEQAAKPAVEAIAPLARDPQALFYEIDDYGACGKLRFVLEDATQSRAACDAALRAIASITQPERPEQPTEQPAS